jgi:hypothetical protein
MKYLFNFFGKVNACYNVHNFFCHNGNFQHVMVDILKNNYDESFRINDGLHPNLSLCCEIGAHTNISIINWSTLLVCCNFGATLLL